ncbi:unnamed protein product [Arabidopsis lyrata]|uniref:uncharacterized protein LOC9326877 n=1 Tax=Arabidopsis lyrata subsp. lyrata TaxID=81972 RepID=UPI000A29D5E9|nr:uncharacterized protein LOC9326877 [Arabidopsis lyrata subsp. lyrata]XP_020867236.1 uncharacterized protein LOC9326877 [Arabidopsis lyrata subsp. lyrata]CAH8253876.1 unnamed protein product [Arabidopsis lyrata]|eukprot:XP_020867235.1 uncharacterized protein LOC9326877 [Arabidopsis lyrata subsp. lyrata]
MPSGAKKRKALKKKKQQEAIGTSTNNNKGFNGNDEHGSQDGRGSDSSLSSPGSQGNQEFGTKDSSAALSSGVVKGAVKEVSGDAGVTQGLGPKSGNAIVVERVTVDSKNVVGKSTNSSSDNRTHPAKTVACGNSVTEITPVVDSVKPVVSLSKAVVSEKSEHLETSTHSNLVKKTSEKNEEYHPPPGLENNNSKVVTLPRFAAETNKQVESVRKSEVPVSPEEKRLLLPGPPAVRKTSFLSCCGLFDALTGSDR